MGEETKAEEDKVWQPETKDKWPSTKSKNNTPII